MQRVTTSDHSKISEITIRFGLDPEGEKKDLSEEYKRYGDALDYYATDVAYTVKTMDQIREEEKKKESAKKDLEENEENDDEGALEPQLTSGGQEDEDEGEEEYEGGSEEEAKDNDDSDDFNEKYGFITILLTLNPKYQS